MSNTYPSQRIATSAKLKPEWYINNTKFWLSMMAADKSISDTITNLNAANGIVDKETYKYVLTPFASVEGDKLGKLPGEIRDIDFITPIKEKNIGEYIDLPYTYNVKVDDPDIIIKRDAEIAALITPIIEQFIINKLNENLQTDIPSKDIGNIEAEIEKIKKSWFDQRAKDVSNLIELLNDKNDFESKRLIAFYNWWATEEVYFYNYIVNGNYKYDLIYPTEGYPILSGQEFVEDGDGFIIKRQMSIFQVETYYGDKLTTKDREYLTHLMNSVSNPASPAPVLAQVYKDIYGRRAINKAGGEYNDTDTLLFNVTMVDEYIIIFKTEVKKQIVTRINQLGELVELVMDEDYVVDPSTGDVESRTIWLPEVWKQILIGDQESGIYLKPEPCEVQIYGEDGSVKLPVVGKFGIMRGMDINPVPKRILPILALYRIINLQIERLIAQYKSPVELIPKGLLAAQDGSIRANFFYRKADSTIIYDETKFSGTEVDRHYKIISGSASSFIRDLIDFRESLKAEAWELANMNDARYGTSSASTTVRNNEQNLYRAKLGSILMTTVFNNVLARQHQMSAEYGNIVHPDGLSGSLMNKETGEVNYFNIPGGSLTNTKFGIFVVNSILEKQKLEEYRKLAFSASQNGDDELAAAAIDGSSAAIVREAINKYSERRKQFQLELEAEKNRGMVEAANLNKEATELANQNKLDAIKLEQQMITDREIQLANIKNANTNKE